MRDSLANIRLAARGLTRAPGFAITASLTLALRSELPGHREERHLVVRLAQPIAQRPHEVPQQLVGQRCGTGERDCGDGANEKVFPASGTLDGTTGQVIAVEESR